MENAIRKLDDTEFKNHNDSAYIRVKSAKAGRRYTTSWNMNIAAGDNLRQTIPYSLNKEFLFSVFSGLRIF